MSLRGRPPLFTKRDEQILVYCARDAQSLTSHGRSKPWLDSGEFFPANRSTPRMNPTIKAPIVENDSQRTKR
jgi:hypothetical protein